MIHIRAEGVPLRLVVKVYQLICQLHIRDNRKNTNNILYITNIL